jgi:hypothetical protein
MLTERAGGCGQAFVGARDPGGQDLALCQPLRLCLPLHFNLRVRLFQKQCCENSDSSQ